MKKRIAALGISMLMLLVLLLSAASADVITSLPGDSRKVQDFYDFARTELTVDGADTTKEGQWFRNFKGDRDLVEEVVAAYVELLTSGGWNFEVNHIHEFEYKKYKAWSISLTYTGTADFPRGTIEELFDDAYTGDVVIWYSGEYSRFEGRIVVAKGLEVEDLGLRPGGENVSVVQPGGSSAAELVENADGSFSTSDGRLTAAPGQAMILRDGVPYTTEEVSINRNREKDKEEILIQRYYRNEGIAMAFPYAMLMTGDSFGMKEMGQDTLDDNEYTDSVEDFFNWKFKHIFGICHSGDYVWAHPDPTQCLQKLLIRVMLWDNSRQICVFYIAAAFDSEPYEIEALAAINLNGAASYNGNAERITMHVGDAWTFSFDDREFMPQYELYQWETLEGSSCVELSGTRSQECRVSAVWEGQARIRATYTYGVIEADVLTGNDTYAEKSKVKEYIIDIVK